MAYSIATMHVRTTVRCVHDYCKNSCNWYVTVFIMLIVYVIFQYFIEYLYKNIISYFSIFWLPLFFCKKINNKNFDNYFRNTYG